MKIIDDHLFPVTNISAAIVTLKPGGLRELHWHPQSDEWQYYVKGKGRMTVFDASKNARTEDFQAGDIGYIEISRAHYIENTGDEDLVLLEVFPDSRYQDISTAQWLAQHSRSSGRRTPAHRRRLPQQNPQERSDHRSALG